MISLKAPPDGDLTQDEIKRIDELLSEARKYHISSLVLAGISIALSSLDQTTGFELPFGKINLPSTQTAVGLYFLVIFLSLASDRLFGMAYRWIHLDPRRPPFPWFALGKPPYSYFQVKIWLLLPILIGAMATAITLQDKDTSGFVLSFVGLLLFLLPRHLSRYSQLISKKEDERGGPATFSIFLLYWLRITRNIVLFGFFLVPIFAIVPRWRDDMLSLSAYIGTLAIWLFVIRWIGGIKFVYRAIDRLGTKLGFSSVSKHYK
jgi:hypothetical protein